MYLNHIRAFKVTKIFCTSFKLSKRIQEKIMALNNSYKTCSAFIDIVCDFIHFKILPTTK